MTQKGFHNRLGLAACHPPMASLPWAALVLCLLTARHLACLVWARFSLVGLCPERGSVTDGFVGVAQSVRDAALEAAAALEAEKAQLKAGLGGALEQRQALEAQLAALSAQQQSLRQAVRSRSPLLSHP